MMRKHITRTLTRSTVECFAVKMVDGKPEVETLAPVTVWGVPSDKEALKAVKEAYPEAKGVTVGNVKSVDETYRVSIDDFVTIAELVADQTNMDEIDPEN